MVNAAQLAVFDIGGSGFELMPRDTGGTPENAVIAVRDAIASGAQMVIGPLFAADVAAVKQDLRTHGLPMLALSTDVSLAEPGLYVMGFAPTPQVERVVSYAAAQGARRFAAMIPTGPYGNLVRQAFEESVAKNGGEIVALENEGNIAGLAARRDQIEALLLPFGGSQLRRIAGQLGAAGFTKEQTKLLGTGLWDEPGLAQGQPLLIGGIFAAAEPEARERFMASYKENYGQEPPRLATLAYDATALAVALAHRGEIDRSLLTSPSGFAGLDGLFRLTAGGQVERGLAVNEVTATGSRVIAPAPATFAGR